MLAEPDRNQVTRRKRRPAKSTVFISYRREDASGFAGRLHEALADHFGEGRVFRDVDTIEPGANFRNLISASLSACGAFVVVIGKEWMVDSLGRRRLHEPDDWVRLELETILGRKDVLVVPVLVERAVMPSVDDLPEALAGLVDRNAMEVSDSRWDFDVKLLTETIEPAVGPSGAPLARRVRGLLVPKGVMGGLGRMVVAMVAVLGVVLGIGPLLRSSPRVKPMSGDYNIAVADFESVDGNGRRLDSQEAHALAKSVHDQLQKELVSIGQSFDLRLSPPDETGAIRGSTPQRRADAAAAKARQMGADVLVYGTLRAEVPNEFVAEFFLSDRQLQSAEELFGHHDLGAAIRAQGDIRRNPVIRNNLRSEILGRTRALAEFIVGLSYYGANQPQMALDHFEAARATDGWDDADGKEVLYLFLGNAAGKLNDLRGADKYYDHALALNPEYSRGLVGRAEVLLHESRGNCEAGNVDAAGLRSALDTYRSALSARTQPAASDIATKVVFSEARVHLCMSQALVGNYWADAEREFQSVIAEFQRGNVRVREMAAESYAGLGFVHLPASGDPDAAARYRRAASDYQTAIELTADDNRKAFFSSMRGYIFGRSGEASRADEAYAEAIRLSGDSPARAGYEKARQMLAAQP